jgi:peptidoglycan/LPS O-acetylase OafA/YrhL
MYRDLIPRRRALLIVSLVVLLLSSVAWLDLALPVCGTYALFYLAFSKTLKMHRFGRFGDFSYGLYLWGWPIQQLLVRHFGAAISPWLLFAMAAPIALVVAAASWHCIEHPFLRLKTKTRAPAGSSA